MALDPSNSSNLEQLALKGLIERDIPALVAYRQNVVAGFGYALSQ